MRRFRFPLQTVLRLREQSERTARRQLAEAMQAAAVIDQRLANVGQGLRDCQDQGRGANATAALARSLEDGLRRYQWRLLQEKQRADTVAANARTYYVERRVELATMQKLRERSYGEWQRAALGAEQQELDELSRLGRAAREQAEAEA
jgi:flagellar export protein FliJ